MFSSQNSMIVAAAGAISDSRGSADIGRSSVFESSHVPTNIAAAQIEYAYRYQLKRRHGPLGSYTKTAGLSTSLANTTAKRAAVAYSSPLCGTRWYSQASAAPSSAHPIVIHWLFNCSGMATVAQASAAPATTARRPRSRSAGG